MRDRVKWLLTAALCGLSAWTAIGIARLQAPAGKAVRQAAAPRENPARSGGKTNLQTVPDPDLARRKAVAACETAALWRWLEEQGDSYSNFETMQPVMEELVDRLGGKEATDIALRLEDGKARERISERMLAVWANRDPWAAYEIYGKYRSEFGRNWGRDVVGRAMEAGCDISAAKVIEVFSATPLENVFFQPAHFAEGFDFAELADFFIRGSGAGDSTGLQDVLDGWAQRSSVAAVKWWMTGEGSGLTDEPRVSPREQVSLSDVIGMIAKSGSEDRNQAFEAMAMEIPEDERRKAVAILQDFGMEGQSMAIDPQKMNAAQALRVADAYLVPTLLQTRGEAELGPSWQAVPEESRDGILQQALEEWQKKDAGPVGQGAREAWREMVEKSWGQ